MNGFDPWWPPQTAFTSQGSPYSSPQTLTDFSNSPITGPSLDPQTAFVSLEPPYLEPAPSATPASPTLVYPTSNLLDPSYSATYPLPLDTAPVILSTDAAPTWSQTIPPSALSQASDSFPVDQSQTDADPTPITADSGSSMLLDEPWTTFNNGLWQPTTMASVISTNWDDLLTVTDGNIQATTTSAPLATATDSSSSSSQPLTESATTSTLSGSSNSLSSSATTTGSPAATNTTAPTQSHKPTSGWVRKYLAPLLGLIIFIAVVSLFVRVIKFILRYRKKRQSEAFTTTLQNRHISGQGPSFLSTQLTSPQNQHAFDLVANLPVSSNISRDSTFHEMELGYSNDERLARGPTAPRSPMQRAWSALRNGLTGTRAAPFEPAQHAPFAEAPSSANMIPLHPIPRRWSARFPPPPGSRPQGLEPMQQSDEYFSRRVLHQPDLSRQQDQSLISSSRDAAGRVSPADSVPGISSPISSVWRGAARKVSKGVGGSRKIQMRDEDAETPLLDMLPSSRELPVARQTSYNYRQIPDSEDATGPTRRAVSSAAARNRTLSLARNAIVRTYTDDSWTDSEVTLPSATPIVDAVLSPVPLGTLPTNSSPSNYGSPASQFSEGQSPGFESAENTPACDDIISFGTAVDAIIDPLGRKDTIASYLSTGTEHTIQRQTRARRAQMTIENAARRASAHASSAQMKSDPARNLGPFARSQSMYDIVHAPRSTGVPENSSIEHLQRTSKGPHVSSMGKEDINDSSGSCSSRESPLTTPSEEDHLCRRESTNQSESLPCTPSRRSASARISPGGRGTRTSSAMVQAAQALRQAAEHLEEHATPTRGTQGSPKMDSETPTGKKTWKQVNGRWMAVPNETIKIASGSTELINSTPETVTTPRPVKASGTTTPLRQTIRSAPSSGLRDGSPRPLIRRGHARSPAKSSIVGIRKDLFFSPPCKNPFEDTDGGSLPSPTRRGSQATMNLFGADTMTPVVSRKQSQMAGAKTQDAYAADALPGDHVAPDSPESECTEATKYSTVVAKVLKPSDRTSSHKLRRKPVPPARVTNADSTDSADVKPSTDAGPSGPQRSYLRRQEESSASLSSAFTESSGASSSEVLERRAAARREMEGVLVQAWQDRSSAAGSDSKGKGKLVVRNEP